MAAFLPTARLGPLALVLVVTAMTAGLSESAHADIIVSDSLELTDADGNVLFNPGCPLVNGQRRCAGSRSEGSEAPGVLTFNVPAPPAGQAYRSATLTLFEDDDPTNISDRVTLIPRTAAGGTINLSVSFVSDSREQGLPFGPAAINIAEDPTQFQDLTALLFSNSTAGIRDNPPFHVMFNSDCGSPALQQVCAILPPLPELPVPEPSSLALLALGLLSMGAGGAAYRRKR